MKKDYTLLAVSVGTQTATAANELTEHTRLYLLRVSAKFENFQELSPVADCLQQS